jgi:hypothetical protein
MFMKPIQKYVDSLINEEAMTGYNVRYPVSTVAYIGEKIFPHGFTSDTNTLSLKEINDASLVVRLAPPEDIAKFINAAEDAIKAATKDGRDNLARDLTIRKAIAQVALIYADVLGKFTDVQQ